MSRKQMVMLILEDVKSEIISIWDIDVIIQM